MAVKPIAGTARMVPATRPLTSSCGISPSGTLDHLHELELASPGLVEADLAVQDVADLGEVARAAGALVVDLLALGHQLEPLDGAVDLDGAALRDLPHGVVDGGAGGVAPGLGDGQHDQADLIVALAGVGIELRAAEERGQ